MVLKTWRRAESNRRPEVAKAASTTCVVRDLSDSPAPAPADRIMEPATPRLVSSPQPPEVPGHDQPADDVSPAEQA